jgi:hypothetical protein
VILILEQFYIAKKKKEFLLMFEAISIFLFFKAWILKFFIAFRLDSILNKQNIIKKIAFLEKMAKIASFS